MGEIFKGSVPLFEVILAPISVKGSTILCIGLEDNELSPTKVDRKFCADNIPEHSLLDVPELPKSSGF